jgi:hypothetical protein
MTNVQPLRRRTLPRVRVLWIAALLAVCCSGTALAAVSSSKSHATTHAKLAGKWHGSYSGAFSGTFTLRWRQVGKSLNGTIKLSKPAGTYAISGSVIGTKIKFGAVAVGATYKGRWSGTKMSGTWKSPQGGGGWHAKKVS